MPMKYIIDTIPHKDQPYNTIADWRFSKDEKTCYINVSEMKDSDYHNALALHELSEIMLLLRRMSPKEAVKKVDAFDKKFEKERKDDFESEPGDDPHAPYHIEHSFATAVERLYMAAVERNWKKYDDLMVRMMKKYKRT